ncbi:heparinase II/III-family protein [Chitinophaga horti]|uniref:Heparinase II/III-family protein n=1 Tax=Chitinophaga horti TaxID=2920382 RepID=A0ABY6IV59_9BACT|nr:heparinase II/III-family protein [Chitinophaga horti]UYQ91253.1 heparinase II/III-family protein [Chitinophaga horti]
MRYLMMVVLLFTGTALARAQQSKQNLLSGKYSKEELGKILIPQAKWTPFPKRQDKSGWAKADAATKAAVIKKAESFIGFTWPTIPATKSLLIVRNGNRSDYQDIANIKREALGYLLLAEVFEDKGRFTDDIINGVWAICEESFWGASAHLPRNKPHSGLPDVSKPFVELFSAETATLLAWVDYFVGDKLDEVSLQVRKRIYHETNYRIFEPLMNQHHGWMAANSQGRPPNNWNPWICSNWLNAVLLLEKDDTKRTAAVHKLLQTLDAFLNPYPADGGCDEGPSYWGAAAASLYDNLAMLNLASNDAFNYVFEDEKVRNMGRYIYRAQISRKYFLNFADADPQPNMDGAMIYRYGKAIKDADMMRFGAYYIDGKAPAKLTRYHYFRNLFEIFMQDEFAKAEKGLPLPADSWLPDLQVFVSRDLNGSTDGYFVAAKGGHNDESHNHNDIGNYVVYYDGQPLLIDVGRGTYTAKTFSDKRYDIWYNRSDYHNLPTVNGQTQLPGMKYKAGKVDYMRGKWYTKFSLDLKDAYPEAAGIEKWQRNILFTKGKKVEISEDIVLKQGGNIVEHLVTCFPAALISPGKIVVHWKSEKGEAKDFYIHYPEKLFGANVEKVKLQAMEDEGIKQKWGDNIYRINFTTVKDLPKAKFTFVITGK